MKLKTIITTALITAALPAASATATTFCVPTYHPACTNNGTNMPVSNLETAATTDSSDGVPDTILVAADHTYSGPDPLTPSGTDPLSIVGAGDTSILTSTSTINDYVVYLYNRPTDLSNVKIVIPASMPSNAGAALITGATTDLVDVNIESKNVGSGGALLVGGTTWSNGHLYATGGGTLGSALDTSGAATGPITASGLLIENASSGIRASSSNAALTVRRSQIVNPLQTAVGVSNGGNLTIENSIVQANNGTALSATAGTVDPVSLTARHVTVVRTGVDGGSSALYTQVQGAGFGAATMTVTDSIIRGFGQLYYLQAPVSPTTGDANITLGYTNATGGATADSGDGSMTLGTGVVSFDPQFVSTSDFRLKPGSPSIDKGDPAVGLTTDFLGALRPVDGDGNGSAIRDQGAYEYQPPVAPPVVPGGGGAAPGVAPRDILKPVFSGLKFAKVTYKKGGALEFSLSEAAKVTVKIKGKGKEAKTKTLSANGKAGANAIKIKAKKLKAGSYTATVTATDAAGNATVKTLKLKVKR